jgi:hypothetical protein
MQTLRKLVDTSSLAISYDGLNQWLYIEWKGDHNKASVLAGFELILRCLQAWECHKLLNDSTQVTSPWEAVIGWEDRRLFQCLAQQGVRYVAWVYSPHSSDRSAIDATLQFTTHPIVIMFEEIATACSWLQQSR